MNDTAYDRAIAYARDEGSKAGRNTAEWYCQDTIGGRTTGDVRPTARRILDAINDGMDLDDLPRAGLSGKWAGSLTGPQLANDALIAAGVYDAYHDPEQYDPDAPEWFTDICDAYEFAFDEACADEIARQCRYQLED